MPVVIGNWENMPTSGDGWIDWYDSQAAIETLPAEYCANTSWSTLGSQSLQLSHNGWDQSLSIKLEYQTGWSRCFSGTTASWSLTLRSRTIGSAGGWGKIENVTLNASGWGWTSLPKFYLYDWTSGQVPARSYRCM